jgi:hypothetical protein
MKLLQMFQHAWDISPAMLMAMKTLPVTAQVSGSTGLSPREPNEFPTTGFACNSA